MIGRKSNKRIPIVIVRPRQVNTIIEEEQEFIDQELTKNDGKNIETTESVLNKQKSSQFFNSKVINLRSTAVKPKLSTENLSNKTDTDQSKQLSEQLTQNLENAEKLRSEKPHLFTKYSAFTNSCPIAHFENYSENLQSLPFFGRPGTQLFVTYCMIHLSVLPKSRFGTRFSRISAF